MVFAAVALAGCDKSWESKVTQPRLKLGATREARTSFPLVIKTGDMELPRFIRLFNSAYFVVVSRDRLRFHVTLHHKWKSMCDPARWLVYIEDGRGRRYYPEGLDRRKVRAVGDVYAQTRDRSIRSVRRTRRERRLVPHAYQETVDELQDGLPLLSINYYRGDGDYVFYRRNIFREDMKKLTLVLKRPGYEYRYVWNFVKDPSASDKVGLSR